MRQHTYEQIKQLWMSLVRCSVWMWLKYSSHKPGKQRILTSIHACTLYACAHAAIWLECQSLLHVGGGRGHKKTQTHARTKFGIHLASVLSVCCCYSGPTCDKHIICLQTNSILKHTNTHVLCEHCCALVCWAMRITLHSIVVSSGVFVILIWGYSVEVQEGTGGDVVCRSLSSISLVQSGRCPVELRGRCLRYIFKERQQYVAISFHGQRIFNNMIIRLRFCVLQHIC